jgi:ABC-2 type transport system permease protein
MTPTTTTDPHTDVRPRAAEFAPSDVTADEPTFARMIGGLGVALATLGTVAVIANQFGPRWIGPGMGYFLGAVGVAAMLYHAVRDADLEFRRAYGFLAVALLLVAAVLFVVPGRPEGTDVARRLGYYFLPWGAGAALVSLLFFIPFVRNETDERYRGIGLNILLVAGATMAAGSVVAGIVAPDTLIGTGLLLALLGLGFLAAYLSQVSTDDGIGRLVAVALGVLGAAAIAYAFGRAAFPTVLFEGPAALKSPFQTYDRWLVAARALTILAFLGIAFAGLRGRGMPGWVRGGLGIVGVGFAAVFLVASFTRYGTFPPQPYLVPAGLMLLGIGIVYLFTALAILSDAPVVVLTRRELAGFFYSPIAYLVVIGVAVVAWVGYLIFVSDLMRLGTTLEPILADYWGATVGAAISVLFVVPALTMRSFSEEKRTGTLEVLLTAPVNEPAIVFSKFLATWLFFLLAWTPIGLYLIALWVHAGPFDYRPMLSYYLAIAASGAGFIAIGLFFSSLTRNQVVAAVLTCAALFVLLMTLAARGIEVIPAGIKAVLSRLDFFRMWQMALSGQLPVTNVLIYLSIAVFFLFLTVKVLEARKWS